MRFASTPAQREIIDETVFEGRTRAQIVKCRGMSESTYDNHLQAAYRSLRTGMMEVVESPPTWIARPGTISSRSRTGATLPNSCAARLAEKGKRSTSQHERSTFKSEASTASPERGKIARERAASAASAAKSRGKRAKTEAEVGAL